LTPWRPSVAAGCAIGVRCVSRSRPPDIDLLVNTGLYHDRMLGEPALAALIQEDIGAHPEDPHEGGHGTFSFDIANGACGVLDALQVADGFLRAGTIRRALVVASDTGPGGRMAAHFPFGATGGALVCGWDDTAVGFVGFRWETSPDDAELFHSRVRFERGRNVLRIHEHPGFGEQAAARAGKAGSALLADHGLRPDDVDLVVTNSPNPQFADALPPHLGVQADRVVTGASQAAHTASLLVALAVAREQGRLERAERTLLLCAGAGITAGAALLAR
jgi:3-oxoacyl-[acyl-carrier-protein] synthase-3